MGSGGTCTRVLQHPPACADTPTENKLTSDLADADPDTEADLASAAAAAAFDLAFLARMTPPPMVLTVVAVAAPLAPPAAAASTLGHMMQTSPRQMACRPRSSLTGAGTSCWVWPLIVTLIILPALAVSPTELPQYVKWIRLDRSASSSFACGGGCVMVVVDWRTGG